jgi:TetR/AcrR family transcriptional regulator
MSTSQRQTRRSGRPKAEDAVDPGRILDAALRAFARHGFDGMSVRMINRELGVSHNLIHQRFGSKDDLWRAAVDHGFGRMVRHLEGVFDPTLTDPLDQLNLAIRRFLVFSAEHPELLGLMDIEARQDTQRLSYIYGTYIAPSLAGTGRLLEHLITEGRIRRVPLRTFHFLVAHGAAAPFTLVPLAERFDSRSPLKPRAVQEHAALIADLLIAGLRIDADNRA